MSVDTMTYTPDDVALAISQMVDAATADLSYDNMQAYTAEYDRTDSEIRAVAVSVARLFGVNSIGDDKSGDDDAAASFAREVEAYRADPTTYVERFDVGEDVQEEQSEQPRATVPAPVAAVTAPIPVDAFEMAPAIAAPIAKISLVDRPAASLFPGISSSYSTEMVPTVKWETPKPKIGTPDAHYVFNGYAVKIMTSAIRRRKNVIATGDPGCGKTEFFKQFAARIGLPFTKVPFDGSLSRAEIIGSFRQVATPTGSATPFVLGLIPTLIQQPGIICLDEVDQCDPDIQYMLHSLYEGEGLTIQEDGGRFIPRHEHCYIVATANTKGRGSDNGLTNAKYEMSEATRDRYPYWLSFTYLKPDQEIATVQAKSKLSQDQAKMLVDIGTSIRNGYNTGVLSQPCSLRQLLDVAELTEDFASLGPNIALALACDTVIVGRANADDGATIGDYIKNSTAVDLTTLER